MIGLACSCSVKHDKTPFDSFIGVWQTSMEDGIYHEKWTKVSTTEFLGNSYLVQGRDTSMYEEFKLVKGNSDWLLHILFEDEAPVIFRAKDFSEGNFKAVNPKNDFPQIINYQKTTTGIMAYITNGKLDTLFFNFTPSK